MSNKANKLSPAVPHRPSRTPKPPAVAPKTTPPAAPPVYRPQPLPRVLQTKKSIPAGAVVPNPGRKPPTPPPVYRPQPAPKVLQRKVACLQQRQPPATQPNRAPAAPPVYRPQPSPAVLQAKQEAGKRLPAGQLSRRSEPGKIVQPKASVIQRMSEEEYNQLNETYTWQTVELALNLLGGTWIGAWKQSQFTKSLVEDHCKKISTSPKEVFRSLLKGRGVDLEDDKYEIIKPTNDSGNCHFFTLSLGTSTEESCHVGSMENLKEILEDEQKKKFVEVSRESPSRPMFAVYFQGSQLAHTAILLAGENEFRHKIVGGPVIECDAEYFKKQKGYTKLTYLAPET
jgi:hypothetical protein